MKQLHQGSSSSCHYRKHKFMKIFMRLKLNLGNGEIHISVIIKYLPIVASHNNFDTMHLQHESTNEKTQKGHYLPNNITIRVKLR